MKVTFPTLQRLKLQWEELQRFADSSCVLLVSVCSVEGFQEISSKDVVWLLSMKSNTMQDMEKSLKEIVTSVEEWKSMCDEIVRTAQSSLALRPELERLVDSFEEAWNNFQDLQRNVQSGS